MIVRITLAALLVVPALMAYPWQSDADRWLAGAAAVVTVFLFARWQGLFVTTIIARRTAILLRRGRSTAVAESGTHVTVVLRLEPREQAELPLTLVAGYLDRYGIAVDKVRVISRDTAGARTTWVALTVAAADNVAALAARSPQLPLRDTAAVAARRLADHLRELGWEVTVEPAPPALLSAEMTQTWRGVRDGATHLAAYRIDVERLADVLGATDRVDAREMWLVAELTGSRAQPEIAAACALRTDDRPGRSAPIPGLTPEHGAHRAALEALATGSHRRLPADRAHIAPELLAQVRWPAGAVFSRT